MTKIPKGFQYAGERLITKHGGSKAINLPSHIIEDEGLSLGDTVKIYWRSGLILIDLKPDVEG